MTDASGMTNWWSYYACDDARTGLDAGYLPLLKQACQGNPPNSILSTITYAYWPHTALRRSMVVSNAASQVYSMDYQYDAADRLTNILSSTLPSFQCSYPYTYKQDWDLIESVKGVCASGTYEQSFTYDNLGRRLSVTSSIKHLGSSIQALSTRTYGYNAAGQRFSQDIQYPASSIPDLVSPDSFMLQYGYDNMGQLTNAYKFRDSVKQKDYMHEIRGRISSGAFMERTETRLE